VCAHVFCCMCVCIYTCVCVCVCVCASLSVSLSLCLRACVCLCLCLCLCVRACAPNVCACTLVCLRVLKYTDQHLTRRSKKHTHRQQRQRGYAQPQRRLLQGHGPSVPVHLCASQHTFLSLRVETTHTNTHTHTTHTQSTFLTPR